MIDELIGEMYPKKIKLLATDLDGTLAEFEKPPLPKTLEKLKELQQNDIQIVISSGKNLQYLQGFAHACGLCNTFLVAENGGIIYYLSTSRPGLLYVATSEKLYSLRVIEKEVKRRFGEKVWIPNNWVISTFFPHERKIDAIRKIVEQMIEKYHFNDIYVVTHADAVDVIPNNVNKGEALKYICKSLGISLDETVAIGDAENDIPMFEVAGYSISIGNKKLKASLVMKDIVSTLDLLTGLVKTKSN